MLGKEQSYKPKLLGVLTGVSRADSKPGEEFSYWHFPGATPPRSMRTEPSVHISFKAWPITCARAWDRM